MVGDMKPFAERQKHRRRLKNIGKEAKTMVGDMKPFAERQKQLAKPFRPWSETIAILLNNKKIHRRSILPMVGTTLPMVEDAQTMVEDTKILAEKQKPWSKTQKY